MWNVTDKNLKKGWEALINAKKRGLYQKVTTYEDLEMLLFLYSKGVLAQLSTVQREDNFKCLINPGEAETLHLQKHYKECHTRLSRLLKVQGDKVSDTPPSHVQTFEKALLEDISGWEPENSYVFHRDHQKLKNRNVLCQRHQLSGLCYIHGPVVLQHYLVWLSQDLDTNPGMIDMTNMVRKSFDAERLGEHILNDKGGSSRHMLGHILLPESVVISKDIDNVTHELLENLGPALVSEFQVHSTFRKIALPSVRLISQRHMHALRNNFEWLPDFAVHLNAIMYIIINYICVIQLFKLHF